jgi:hypothetical protein
MPRRRRAPVDTALSERATRLEITRAQLFDVDVNRRKRIDDAIDYFGAGHIGVARDPCGESLLDGSAQTRPARPNLSERFN